MKLVRKGKISYMQPDWVAGSPVQAGFSTRNGGVSRPPYNSLNLGYNTEDARHNVEGNRSTLTRAFDLHPHQLLTVKQVHGTDILIVDQPNYDLSHFLTVASDAIITDQPGFMFGVLVADCFPVLMYDPNKRVGAAVHAGWRGAASGLLGKTAEAMQSHFGCRPPTDRVSGRINTKSIARYGTPSARAATTGHRSPTRLLWANGSSTCSAVACSNWKKPASPRPTSAWPGNAPAATGKCSFPTAATKARPAASSDL
jgi:hypothetical protein